jgi:hypothetical protein
LVEAFNRVHKYLIFKFNFKFIFNFRSSDSSDSRDSWDCRSNRGRNRSSDSRSSDSRSSDSRSSDSRSWGCRSRSRRNSSECARWYLLVTKINTSKAKQDYVLCHNIYQGVYIM